MNKIFIPVFILLIVGIFLSYSINSAMGVKTLKENLFIRDFNKHIVFVLIGLAVFLIVSKMNYEIFLKLSNYMMVAFIFLLVLVLIPGVGKLQGGSLRWIDIGVFDFQPSQASVIMMPLIGAKLFSGKFQNERDKRFFYVFVFFTFLIVFLIALEPDLGTAFIVFLTSLFIMVFVGIRFKTFLMVFFASFAGVALILPLRASWVIRLTSFLDPSKDPLNTGYQIISSITAIARGGITGMGYMRSVQKYFPFPGQRNDFVFSIFVEEWGLIGGLFLLLLFLIFVLSFYMNTLKLDALFGKIFAFGIGSYIIIETFINVGVTIGILPTTGVPLPFVSQGGNHILFEMLALGISANIFKKGIFEK